MPARKRLNNSPYCDAGTSSSFVSVPHEEHAIEVEDPEQPLTVDERRAQARSVAGPLDRALMDRPIGSPRSYEPRLRTGEQLTHPSLALSGDVIEKLEGYDVHGMLVSEATHFERCMRRSRA